jgi:hypothetical protein
MGVHLFLSILILSTQHTAHSHLLGDNSMPPSGGFFSSQKWHSLYWLLFFALFGREIWCIAKLILEFPSFY